MDALAETLKGLRINDAGYYESDSANANDEKGDPEIDPKRDTHTSDWMQIKVTDNSNGDLQQNILSNWILPIITSTVDPRIYDRVPTSVASTIKLAASRTTEVITDTACSNT